ncbi:uncharacterized protein LOC120113176 [Phoenix dactylifera]|uniref:Uncharacterized protein LOC120113176 n=1 Tax=Phoenix dactylifera TaxID=42345 RepID=A0A8B9AWE0_PHODC|nr:uncharacterized protein LOC120113176 [Phoenix dactylifera]
MSVERTLAPEQEALTWQRFRTAFYSKYFPSSRLRELEREFLNLNQGTMTVDEYEAEFDRLSRAKNLEIVWKETYDDKDRKQKKRSRDYDARSGQNSSKTAKSHNQSWQSGKQGSYGKTIQQEKQKCDACGGMHKTEHCRQLSGAYFRCGQQGHKVAECPQQDLRSVQRPQTTRTQQVQPPPALAQSAQPSSPKQQKGGRPRTQGRIYALTQQDAQASNTVVSEHDLHVSTPAGSGMIGNQVCKTCPVQIVGRDLPIDLIVIDMHDFDIILGMDWLASYFATINCHEKRVNFRIPGDTEFSFMGSGAYTSPQIVSAMQIKRLLRKGSVAYIATVVDTRQSDQKLEDISVVNEYSDVFPEDLPGYYRRFVEGFSSIAAPLTRLTRKEVKFEWSDKCEQSFQELKQRLVSAPILTLPSSGEDYTIYNDTSKKGLGCVLMQNDKVIAYASRQLKSYEENYPVHDLELAAVVFALKIWRHYLYGESCKVYTDHKSLKYLFTQKELNMDREDGSQSKFRLHKDGSLRYGNRIYIPNNSDLKNEIMREAHNTGYTVHPGGTKMYKDLKGIFWWNNMKREIAQFVAQCLTCQQVKAEHQRPAGLLQPPLPEWKWKHITMDFVSGLPRTPRGYDAIWVIVDRLTKSAHVLAFKVGMTLEKFAELYIEQIVRLHGVPVSIVSDRDSRFVSHFWGSLNKALGTTLSFSTAFHPQTDGKSARTIQTLEDMLRACVMDMKGSWDCHLPLVEKIMGPEIVQQTVEKIQLIRERLRIAQSRQKSYADNRRRELEFQIGDHVFLRVSPTKGVMRFGIRGKLSPRYVGPFEILKRVGAVAYKLALPPSLSGVHNVFHVSMLRKYIPDISHVVEVAPLQFREDLTYPEQPVRVVDIREQVLRRRTISYVKIQWSNHSEREATWELEDEMKEK